MRNYRQQEASARVGALLHNHGRTYKAAALAAGFGPVTLSRWARQLQTPRDLSLSVLRDKTS